MNKSFFRSMHREFKRLPSALKHLTVTAITLLGLQLTYLVLDVIYDLNRHAYDGSDLGPIMAALEGAPTAPFYLVCTVTYLLALYSVLDFKQKSVALFTEAVNTNSIVVRLRPDATIIEANQYFCDLLKIEKASVPGMAHSSFVKDHVRGSRTYKYFWKKLREGSPYKGTYERVATDGTSVWVTGTYIPLKGRDGTVFEILKVANDVTEQIQDRMELQSKNTYLEHAAKILRHDMHSGINTYIPRGIRSLERRLMSCPEVVEKLNLQMPLRLLKEGLAHTQKVYSGVKEFTNLVKPGAELEMQVHDLGDLLRDYLSATSYKSQVVLGDLPAVEVNGPLFCTAIDNLIRNGLKYNDSQTKVVRVESEDGNHIVIIDNGRGMTKKEFEEYSKPYVRKKGQTEAGSGLGLNICIAILREHDFSVTCEKASVGTRIRIQTHD